MWTGHSFSCSAESLTLATVCADLTQLPAIGVGLLVYRTEGKRLVAAIRFDRRAQGVTQHRTSNYRVPQPREKSIRHEEHRCTVVGVGPLSPTQSKQATVLQLAYLHERRKAPHGIVGTAETGFLEFKGRGDPDAKGLLRDLRRRY